MSHAFISYSSKDRDFVLKMAGDLRAAGCTLWLDHWNIVGRDPFWDEIQSGIEGCSHFLFVISPDSIERHSGALTELLHAASLQPPPIIVPIMARETPYQKLPIVVSPGKYQIHDFTRQPYDDSVERVARALKTDALTTAPIERLVRMQLEAPTRAVPIKKPRATCSASLMRLSVTVALTAVAATFVILFSQGQSGQTSSSQVPQNSTTSLLNQQSGTGAGDAATDMPIGLPSRTPEPTPSPSPSPTPPPIDTPTVETSYKNPPMPDCPNAPAPRLSVGQRGRVTPGLDNRINDRPARVASGAIVVALMHAGSEFDVLAGPVCADGLVWWQVQYDKDFGWTAEGEGTTYWLEPVG